jgi:hypothetical protein
MSARFTEVKVMVIEDDVPIQAIKAIFQFLDVQDQTSMYVIYRWVCGAY